jgi:hypothetical protein
MLHLDLIPPVQKTPGKARHEVQTHVGLTQKKREFPASLHEITAR